MSNALTIPNEKPSLSLYDDMRKAISKCWSIDEIKSVVDRSIAMTAYYKQIKDDESVRLFWRIKLRAWKRIGDLFKSVDVSSCEYKKDIYATIRAAFSDPVTRTLSDASISMALKAAEIADEDFDRYAAAAKGSLVALIAQGHPANIAARAQFEADKERMLRGEFTEDEIAHKQRWAKRDEELALAEQLRQDENAARRELEVALGEAAREVGITLSRKDRHHMKTVVFILRAEIHSTLRQAAFDHKITMQEVLRRGLAIWLAAHGYRVAAIEDEESKAA